MMKKTSQAWMFLYIFFFTMIILLFTSYIILFASGRKLWLQTLLKLKISFIPLIAYLIIVGLVVALVLSLFIYFLMRNQVEDVDKKVEQLALGKYDSPLLSEKDLSDDLLLNDINRNVERIRVKMMTMSKELQVLSARPVLVEGESKEAILRNERQRLARELHDSVSQQLFAASMMLSALIEESKKRGEEPKLQKQMDLIEDIINTSQSEMRALLLHLRPITLEGKSLQKGIEQLLKELQTKIKIELIWDIEDIALMSSIEDNLFRIVQELLSNTLRHAKAKSLEVYLKKLDDIVMLRVVDDGVGFDTSQTKVGSYGINNIHERVSQMGGTCKIISFKNSGTSIEIRVPLVGESAQDDKSTIS